MKSILICTSFCSHLESLCYFDKNKPEYILGFDVNTQLPIKDEEITFSAKQYKMTPYLEDLVAEARKEREDKQYKEEEREDKKSGKNKQGNNRLRQLFSSSKDFIKSLEN